jgi:site-specific recombinase xerD
MDAKTLSEILGHSDVKTTLNKYVHSSFELKQTSIDKLPFDYAI